MRSILMTNKVRLDDSRLHGNDLAYKNPGLLKKLQQREQAAVVAFNHSDAKNVGPVTLSNGEPNSIMNT